MADNGWLFVHLLVVNRINVMNVIWLLFVYISSAHHSHDAQSR